MSGTRPADHWVRRALDALAAEATRSADTNLLTFALPSAWGIDLYLKDESAHPTGSLKHRLARSLFVYGICNGLIHQSTTIIEASSGSTAVSEAYFARLLDLDFIAVVPASTSAPKFALIEQFGGRSELVDTPAEAPHRAATLAAATGGHFMDQFRYAERASDWRGPDTIAESLFGQLAREPHPEPDWIVVGAGTGGTSATIGRYLRWTGRRSRLAVVDPPGSVLLDTWHKAHGAAIPSRNLGVGTVIEGIGRPSPEESFLPKLVDAMLAVPDEASLAGMLLLERHWGRRCGGSTGTNLIGALAAVARMRDAGRTGSVVTLVCDSGDRYESTLWSQAWLAERHLSPTGWVGQLDAFLTGAPFPLALQTCQDHHRTESRGPT